MNDKATLPLEPTPEAFAGSGPAALARRLCFSTRPQFLPASALPVVVGSAWGYAQTGSFDWLVGILALIATMAVHAGANVLNDVGDDIGGTDRINDERLFPFTGGSRFIQNEIMSRRAMSVWGSSLIGFAALLGLALIALRGPSVLVFGLIGVGLAVLYSLPGVQLAARGVGEAAVAVAFGLLPVAGSAWLQTGTVDLMTLIVAVPVSMWVAAILLINEVPDMRADGATGKRTLVVRLGLEHTARIYLGLHLTALAAAVIASLAGALLWLATGVIALLSLEGMRASRSIPAREANREALARSVKVTPVIHTAGSVVLAVGLVFA